MKLAFAIVFNSIMKLFKNKIIINNMEEKIDEMLSSLTSIDGRLDAIEKHLKIINTDCSRMNDHIQFIEKTYNATRAPLNYIKNKIEHMMSGSSTTELPKLEYKDPSSEK